jgi:8-oxo-dGTP pyrophosphatase MutT (NUDIX family)
VIEIASITAALCRYVPGREPTESVPSRHASVSIILAGPAADLSICFIKRAAHPNDPWSGQMALPGGRASADDPHPHAVAVRETHEEVGLNLKPSHDVGALSEMQIGRHRRRNLGVLSPFVFHIAGPLPEFVPEISEVAAAYWVPSAHLWNPANIGSIEYDGSRWPGIEYQGEIIWGLTLRVMQAFADVIEKPLCEGQKS